MPHRVLGLDIGGANLKAVHSSGTVLHEPFELWRQPTRLPEVLRELLGRLPSADLLAVTMTGELCDCFATRREGVRHILHAVEQVSTVVVQVWLTDGRFASVPGALADPILAAASNWLALATWAGRLAPNGPALLLDIGSTTTDIIPLLDGLPVPRGRTDPERLRSGELVYTGVRRTPLMALLGSEGAAEYFATTLDAYVSLGLIAEDPNDFGTADGRPATRASAQARLARMLCGDSEDIAQDVTLDLARRIEARQLDSIRKAIHRVSARLPKPPGHAVICGSGEFLGAAALSSLDRSGLTIHRLSEILGANVSGAACAFAVAVLAQEQIDVLP